jgi:hypothetical protein
MPISISLYSCREKEQEPETPQQIETIESISLSKHSIELFEGCKDTLKYMITPSSLQEEYSVTWLSSSNNIANVVNGIVTAKRKGYCWIYATVNDTTLLDSCKVTVSREIIPPTIRLSNLKSGEQELTMTKVSETKYIVYGVHAQNKVSGNVEFGATKYIYSVAMTYNTNQVNDWRIGMLDWSSDYITSMIQKPENGTYSYVYTSGCSFSSFSFSFILTGYDPISVPINFSISDRTGTNTTIEVLFTN